MMMKWLWTSLALAVFSTVAMGQKIKLEGRLITDQGEPVPNTRVRVGDEQPALTDANGVFSTQLSAKAHVGERVVIVVEKKNWLINQPLDGEWTLPAMRSHNLDVVIVPWGSKALWTDARIEKELKRKPDQIGKGFELDEYIQALARKYGSTPQVTKEAFDKWATNQNENGNALKEQGRRLDGPEAVRLLGEAVSAYRRALSIFTSESKPLEWATTQHNLGNALQEQGSRATASEAIRLLAESVAAYRQSLTIRTREQLPRQWATTQNDLGNALQGQGTRAQGTDATRLLGEAAAAYSESLLFFTREYVPQDWAMIQHNLGSALHERGTRTEGPEALRLLGEAVVAYRQALLVRTRERVPQQWAVTQNNLANALQAQATRTAGAAALHLLDEAVTAYRQSLLVFTRDRLPKLWAMTKHNLGSALQEQGARAQGSEAERLLGEAVAAYLEALQVWTREQRPQQWTMAQNNLARAYLNLKDWTKAAECYQQLLELYFTSGSFVECQRWISAVLSDDRVDERIKIPVRAIEVANLIALKRSAEVPSKMQSLIAALQSQPSDFKVEWSFGAIKKFTRQNPELAANNAWLEQLFAAMEGKSRDEILQKLAPLTNVPAKIE